MIHVAITFADRHTTRDGSRPIVACSSSEVVHAAEGELAGGGYGVGIFGALVPARHHVRAQRLGTRPVHPVRRSRSASRGESGDVGRGPDARFEIVRVMVPAQDVAVAHVSRVALEDRGEAVESTGNMNDPFSEMALYVLVRHSGSWWLAAGQNTIIGPPARSERSSAASER